MKLSVSGANFTAQSSYASVVLGIVILSICLSVTRLLCDEIIEHTADILIPNERVMTVVFWYQHEIESINIYQSKSALKFPQTVL